MLTLKVSDMSCGGCVATITKAVHRIDPAATVEADLSTKEVTVASSAGSDSIVAAIRAADYDPVLA